MIYTSYTLQIANCVECIVKVKEIYTNSNKLKISTSHLTN